MVRTIELNLSGEVYTLHLKVLNSMEWLILKVIDPVQFGGGERPDLITDFFTNHYIKICRLLQERAVLEP